MELHKFTYTGKHVLALRVINADKTSGPGNDFVNPTEPGSIVECPDWKPTNECGNGLHAWPWGFSRAGKDPTGDKIWQVVKADPETGIDLGYGKAKWPKFEIVYSGNQAMAMHHFINGQKAYKELYPDGYILNHFIYSDLMNSLSYDMHHPSSIAYGYNSIAISDCSNGTAVCVNPRSLGVTTATVSSVEVKNNSVAVCMEPYSTAKAGKGSVIVMSDFDEDYQLVRGTAYVWDGENGTLLPNVWYTFSHKDGFQPLNGSVK